MKPMKQELNIKKNNKKFGQNNKYKKKNGKKNKKDQKNKPMPNKLQN